MLLSIIIPCLNEELVLTETYKRLMGVVKELPFDYELVLINNGSSDGTLSIMRQLATQDKQVKVLSLSRNFGHQNAVTSGLHHCTGDYAVIMDADLQDPPEVIKEMFEIMEREKANVVYGVRKRRKGESWFKLVTAKYFYRTLNKLSDVDFPVDTGDFRLMDRKVIEAFKRFPEKNKYIRGLVSWMGFKQVPCYYEREPRFAGETKYPLRQLFRFAGIGLFYFSKKPLKIASTTGFICVAISLVYAVSTLISKLNNPDLPLGWTTLVLLIVFFGGVQLLTIGILGQYIGNLFDEAKDRPEYIIEEKINW